MFDRYWCRNGQMGINEDSRNGKLNGKCIFYNGNENTIIHEEFQDTKLEGERKKWYMNGQMKEYEVYRDGRLDGVWKSWYENGRPRAFQFFHHGKRDGEVKAWNIDGSVKSWQFFRDSEPVDCFFTRKKKCGFLRIKRFFAIKIVFPVITDSLILDLAKIVCNFIPS